MSKKKPKKKRKKSKGKYDGLMYCEDCRIQSKELDFKPTNGNPSPWLCPHCGRTEIFTVDEDQASIGLHDWENVRDKEGFVPLYMT